MAPLDDLYTSLALGQAQKEAIAATDPYARGVGLFDQLGSTVATSGANYDLKDKLIYGAISGLLSGGLGNLSQDYQSRAQDAYQNAILGSMQLGGGIEKPDVLSDSLFRSAQNQGKMALFKRLLSNADATQKTAAEMALEDRKLQNQRELEILKAKVSNPRMAPKIDQALGIAPTGIVQETKPLEKIAVPLESTGDIDPVTRYNQLLEGVDNEKVAETILQNELATKRATTEREIAAKEKQKEDFAKNLLEKQVSLDNTKSILSQLETALKGSGATGTFSQPDSILALQSALGGDEAAKRLSAQAQLERLGNLSISELRKAMGTGAASDFESRLMKGSSIGKSQPRNVNEGLYSQMNKMYNIADQKQKFLTKALQDGLTQVQAETAYNNFNKVLPDLVNEDINPDRLALDFNTIETEKFFKNEIKPKKNDDTKVIIEQPKQEVVAQQSGGNLFNRTFAPVYENIIEPGMIAGADFGNTALLGLPKQAVVAARTAGDEIKDLFGMGQGKTISENYLENLGQTNQAFESARSNAPLISTGASLAGAFASPITKVKTVKNIFDMKGIAGLGARAGLAAGTAGIENVENLATEKGTDSMQNAALLSAGLDAVSKGASKLAPAASTIFKKTLGIGSADYREAAKSFSKDKITEAAKKFDDAINIVQKEHGLPIKDLGGLKGDETVLQDIVSKAHNSIKSRNEIIDKEIIANADFILEQNGARLNFLKPQNKGDALEILNTQGQKIKVSIPPRLKAAIDNAGKDQPQIREEAAKILTEFNRQFPKGATFEQMQLWKKSLNKDFKAGQAYNDTVTALALDFKDSIESNIEKLVKAKQLPADFSGAIKRINQEEGKLIAFRDAVAKKLPGAMANDIISEGQRMLYTTGGSSAVGASTIANNVGLNPVNAALGMLISGSNRFSRPISKLLSDPETAEFLSSPEFRNAMTQASNTATNLPETTTMQPSNMSREYRSLDEILGLEKKNLTEDAMTEDVNLDEPETFGAKVDKISANLEIDPQDLLAVMKFETGGELDSKTKNRAGSGATGLIQFMPSTAKELTGADSKKAAIEILESMSPTEQLDYVEKYLSPFKGKLKSLEDLYMAVLYPKAVGKDLDYPLFKEKDYTKVKKELDAYWLNRGLDLNKDGIVTKEEAASKVKAWKV